MTKILITPLGLGFEALGPSPRSVSWTLSGYGATPEEAAEDYRMRYSQERDQLPFQPTASFDVEVEVPAPYWEILDAPAEVPDE